MKKTIKKAAVNDTVEKQKKAHDLKQDIQGFFPERDKTKRGLEGRIEDTKRVSEAELELEEILYDDSLIEVPVPEGIEPMFNSLFVTAKRNRLTTPGGLLISKTVNSEGLEIDYQEIQTVMAVGPQVQQVKLGYSVVINYENFRKMKSEAMVDKVQKNTKLEIPTEVIDGVQYIVISERDIKYINNNLK